MNFVKISGKDFEMADAPVTKAEWFEVMGTEPSYFKKGANAPVESVSWNNCQEFIVKMNNQNDGYTYRLPTEEEWEFCAKSCDEQPIYEISWTWENSDEKTHPVKQKKPNTFGLYDMLGNVWEWCEDLYDPSWAGSNRVVRGGSWGSYARSSRSASRNDAEPDGRGYVIGFRLVRTPRNSLPFNPIALNDSKLEQALAIAREALRKIEELLK